MTLNGITDGHQQRRENIWYLYFMENPSYRLDRTSFQMLSFEEADREMQGGTGNKDERIRYFNYLMSIAYRFLGEPWPRMDRTFFEMRKHNNG